MNTSSSETILDHAHREDAAGEIWRQPLVPIHNPALFDALAGEVIRFIHDLPGEHLTLIVDQHTARALEEAEQIRSLAESILVANEAPDSWRAAGNVSVFDGLHKPRERERFLVLRSDIHNVALIGAHNISESYGGVQFRGGWTCLAAQVDSLANVLQHMAGLSLDCPRRNGTSEHAMTLVSRLTAIHVNEASSIDRTRPLAKDDLLSVLDILKAISAKRRSHDILYVFVEQIARSIHVNRCSVLRIWGGEEHSGHVLASHEDASVDDLIIDIDRYPEIALALNTHAKVVIEDVRESPLTHDFVRDLEDAGIRSLIVVPIVLYDPNVGSLFLRAARRDASFTPREVGFCEIVAEAASNALERAHLFDSIQRANQRLERLATTDGLTELYNHRFFTERLEEEFVRAIRYNLPLTCLMVDIDNFKQINDTYGHLVGDNVLRAVSERIQCAVRHNDIVARYGGEEFAVLLPQTGVDGAAAKAQFLLELIRSEPFDALPPDVPVTVSVGVGVLDRNTMTTYQQLIRQADEALYAAKGAGKNCVVLGSTQGEIP